MKLEPYSIVGQARSMEASIVLQVVHGNCVPLGAFR